MVDYSDQMPFIRWARARLASMLGVSHGGARDQWDSFGYPQEVTIDMLRAMYFRNGVANRIVRAYPQATWREKPIFKDENGDSPEKGETYSPWVKEVWDLIRQFNILAYLERVDRLSGIGQFGVLLMGFADGLPGNVLQGRSKLTYLRAYGEPNAKIVGWEQDRYNSRFGQPTTYQLRAGNFNNGGPVAANINANYQRLLHLAEHLDENETFSTPRLLPVYNHLMDLEKVLGSSAETFWRNSSGTLVFSADKDAQIGENELKEMKNQSEELQNQMRRSLALKGVTATQLQTNIADPATNVDKLLDLIAGGSGIPKRILLGTERGELSSSQDENNWAARIDERQNGYATPSVLRPFITRMIETGNLTEPKGEWSVEWPDSGALSPAAFAEVGAKKADTLNKYLMTPGAEDIVPVPEFRTDFLGLPAQPEEYEVEEELDETDPDVQAQFSGESVAETPADTALNGAQISSLKDIVLSVADGTLPMETGVQLILVGFPTVSEEVARAILLPVEEFRKEKEEESDVGETTGTGDDQLALPAPGAGDTEEPEEELVANALRVISRAVMNSAPRSLYVRRDVVNSDAIREHFKRQGLGDMVPAKEMHVTIIFSRRPVDWMKFATDWVGPEVKLPAGGPRQLDLYGPNKDVLVLLFASDQLRWRHDDFRREGCSWDFPDYQPHISLTHKWDKEGDVSKIEPYTGEIILGPERFEEVKDDWKDGVKENTRAS